MYFRLPLRASLPMLTGSLAGSLVVLLTSPAARAADIGTDPLVSSSVRVFCKTQDGIGMGSGFVVGKDGKFAVTNSHVIASCQGEIIVMSPRSSGEAQRTVATVVWDSRRSMSKRHLDAALLSLADSVGSPGVAFASRATVAQSDAVIAVGYPADADTMSTRESLVRPSITQGTVSRFLKQKSDREGGAGAGLYQITASIGPGNSGGPLFNAYGEVIGINTAKSLINVATLTEEGDVKQARVPLLDGVSWAQEIDELLPVLSEQGIAYDLRVVRHGRFWSWLHRESETAAALGAVLLLLLGLLGLQFYKRSPAARASGLTKLPAGPAGTSAAKAPAAGIGAGTAGAFVEGRAGPYAGKRFPLQSDLIFGRDGRSCNVVFGADHDGISARHCALRYDASARAFELRDLGSANGTFAGGVRLKPGATSRLRDGDEFHLFKRDFRFTVRAGPAG